MMPEDINALEPEERESDELEESEAASSAPQLSAVGVKARLEAALYITGRALSVKELADIIEASYDETEESLLDLINEYNFRDESGLEIDDSDGYILQVRESCSAVLNKMMPAEISHAAVRTLSAIAIKAPILQSDLIELRGSTAYDHIGELLAMKLISKKRKGRSYLLNTTPKFHQYFKLTGDKKELEYLVREQLG